MWGREGGARGGGTGLLMDRIERSQGEQETPTGKEQTRAPRPSSSRRGAEFTKGASPISQIDLGFGKRWMNRNSYLCSKMRFTHQIWTSWAANLTALGLGFTRENGDRDAYMAG